MRSLVPLGASAGGADHHPRAARLPPLTAPQDHVLASDARITETVRKYLEDE
ncbi:MAG: hypothetical protein ACM32E_10965 [Gemmatimonadota bacterium]